jgi:hypothetical protein
MTGTKLSKTFTIKETFQITWTNLSKHSKKKKKKTKTLKFTVRTVSFKITNLNN